MAQIMGLDSRNEVRYEICDKVQQQHHHQQYSTLFAFVADRTMDWHVHYVLMSVNAIGIAYLWWVFEWGKCHVAKKLNNIWHGQRDYVKRELYFVMGAYWLKKNNSILVNMLYWLYVIFKLFLIYLTNFINSLFNST